MRRGYRPRAGRGVRAARRATRSTSVPGPSATSTSTGPAWPPSPSRGGRPRCARGRCSPHWVNGRLRSTAGRVTRVMRSDAAARIPMATAGETSRATLPPVTAPIPCQAMRPADSTPWTWPRIGVGVRSSSLSCRGSVAENPYRVPREEEAVRSPGCGQPRAPSDPQRSLTHRDDQQCHGRQSRAEREHTARRDEAQECGADGVAEDLHPTRGDVHERPGQRVLAVRHDRGEKPHAHARVERLNEAESKQDPQPCQQRQGGEGLRADPKQGEHLQDDEGPSWAGTIRERHEGQCAEHHGKGRTVHG